MKYTLQSKGALILGIVLALIGLLAFHAYVLMGAIFIVGGIAVASTSFGKREAQVRAHR